MTDSPLTHKLRLSKGAAIELANLIGAGRGILVKPALIRRVSQFGREHLRAPPEYRDGLAGMADWSEETFAEVEITERVRDALKALVQSAAEKGVLSCAIGVGDLLAAFGIGDDE